MRVASYNILDGGQGRADPIAEVLVGQRADVVALVEAERAEVTGRIARRLGMQVVPGEGPRRSVAVLTRLPVLASVNHAHRDGGPRACLEVVVETAAGEVPVFVVHLLPHRRFADEQRRLGEVRTVLAATERHRAAGRPHLVVGDFNSVALGQVIHEDRLRPQDLAAYRENENQMPTAVVGAMAEAGYVDAFAALHPGADGGTLDAIHAGLRVDYTFVWGTQPRAAWIEADRLARYASDHLPVGVEIDA
jgi:endonuclease/exonuclease/phosphatase family metal-dependent hydrolase